MMTKERKERKKERNSLLLLHAMPCHAGGKRGARGFMVDKTDQGKRWIGS